jgi:WD40 repeat protein
VWDLHATQDDNRPLWLESIFGLESKSLAISPSENFLAVATRNYRDAAGLKIYDLRAKREVHALREVNVGANVAFSPDGNYLVLVEGGLSPRILVYDGKVFNLIETLDSYMPGSVRDLRISPDNDLFATAGRAPFGVRLWRLPEGGVRQDLEFDPAAEAVTALAFSPEGRFLATATSTGRIWFWDRSTGKRDETPTVIGQTIKSICFNPAGDVLAVGLNLGEGWVNPIELWRVAQRERITSLEQHQDAVNALAFSSDGSVLASAGQDFRLHLWGILR